MEVFIVIFLCLSIVVGFFLYRKNNTYSRVENFYNYVTHRAKAHNTTNEYIICYILLSSIIEPLKDYKLNVKKEYIYFEVFCFLCSTLTVYLRQYLLKKKSFYLIESSVNMCINEFDIGLNDCELKAKFKEIMEKYKKYNNESKNPIELFNARIAFVVKCADIKEPINNIDALLTMSECAPEIYMFTSLFFSETVPSACSFVEEVVKYHLQKSEGEK